jgi:GMP synthase-like glutamine amidotransferase
MNIHYFIHVKEELPGAISHWAQNRGFRESFTRFYLGELPDESFLPDMLVIMGGPMNIYEDDRYPYLVSEKAFIKKAVDAGIMVLGVCLGAQLLADVCGGKVTRNHTTEIGWFPVTLTQEGESSYLFKDITFEKPVLHWHGDTFSIPGAGIHLLRSEACEHQAFLLKDRLLGFQFHFEMTPETLDLIIHLDRDSLQKSRWIMSEDEIRKGLNFTETNHAILYRILDAFMEKNQNLSRQI